MGRDPRPVARLTFPQQDWQSEEARLWAALTAEKGFNPGNRIADAADGVAEPGTEFTCARRIVYRLGQQGRGALPPESCAEVLRTGIIAADLTAEPHARREAKRAVGHVDAAAG